MKPQITIANLDARIKGVLKDAKAAKAELMNLAGSDPMVQEVKKEIIMVVSSLENINKRWENTYNKYRR